DTYSTGVSLQNLLPRTDRRILTVAIGVLTTVLALTMDIGQYAGFLTLIGSVFVPLFGVLAADYFGRRRHRDPAAAWDLSESSPSRWRMLLAWLLGLAVYQLINTGDAGAWSEAWRSLAEAVHFTPASWMSASLLSFVVAAALALLFGLLPGGRGRN
ncbi:MAG: cytosine permease, partial [Sciscionella sp.]